MGVPRSEGGIRTTGALELLDRLWVANDVSSVCEIFAVEDVSINPKPFQPGRTDVWLGATAPPAVRRAATLGDAWPIDARTPRGDIPDSRSLSDAALDGDAAERPIKREVFVAKTDDRARELAMPWLAQTEDTDRNWGGGHAMGKANDLDGDAIADRFVIGSPGTVVQGLERYRDDLGIDHVVVRHRWPGTSVGTARSSLELFADEGVPALRAGRVRTQP